MYMLQEVVMIDLDLPMAIKLFFGAICGVPVPAVIVSNLARLKSLIGETPPEPGRG